MVWQGPIGHELAATHYQLTPGLGIALGEQGQEGDFSADFLAPE